MKCPIDVEKKVAEMRQELHPDALVEDAYRAILGAMNGAYCDGLQGKGTRPASSRPNAKARIPTNCCVPTCAR